MEQIKQLIQAGKTDEAILLLNEYLATQPADDQAWYLRGKAYYKKGETRLALNDYLEAIARNPESPAQQAYNMAMRILNFYNKDMYNQWGLTGRCYLLPRNSKNFAFLLDRNE